MNKAHPNHVKVMYLMFLRIARISWPYILGMLIVSLGIMARNVPGIVLDDGAFFLKYAENMSIGHFWQYNIEDAPVWGASAPLYPLLVAPLIKIGISGVLAIKTIGFALVNFTTCIAIRFFKQLGILYGLFCSCLIALSTVITSNAIAGLETPLSLSLISLTLLILKGHRKVDVNPFIAAGSAAVLAILGINKLDLLPLSILAMILYAVSINRSKFAMSVSVATYSLIIVGSYSFFWKYFGSPLPNSFVTKALHQERLRIIDWSWFTTNLYIENPFKLILFLIFVIYLIMLLFGKDKSSHSIDAFILSDYWRPAVCCLFLVAYMTLAYTVKPPFEPYPWYLAPPDFALSILSTFGMACLINHSHTYMFLRKANP